LRGIFLYFNFLELIYLPNVLVMILITNIPFNAWRPLFADGQLGAQ
jgi:hypothetical protein